MLLAVGCPRCPAPVLGSPGQPVSCRDHGSIVPLLRSVHGGYDEFAEHLRLSEQLPTLLPWPLGGGWAVADFGVVTRQDQPARATFATCAGTTDADGVLEISIVTEEPGVGLGARCAGLSRTDPGGEVGVEPAPLRLDVEGVTTPVWVVSTSDADADFDRMVFAGESHGRWLWVVVRPASAALVLHDLGALVDVSGLGASLVDLPFTDHPPAW
ncbi:MAG: hypothetical protein QM655_00315 [Nocardioidaceae bacterium]